MCTDRGTEQTSASAPSPRGQTYLVPPHPEVCIVPAWIEASKDQQRLRLLICALRRACAVEAVGMGVWGVDAAICVSARDQYLILGEYCLRALSPRFGLLSAVASLQSTGRQSYEQAELRGKPSQRRSQILETSDYVNMGSNDGDADYMNVVRSDFLAV